MAIPVTTVADVQASAPDPAVVAERMDALRDAVASQQLEGLEPSPTVIAALQRVAHSELTIEEVVAEIHARIARGEV